MAGKILLALDGATPILSIAIVQGGDTVLAAEERGPGESHSLLLPSLLQDLMERAEVRLHDLDGVAVGVGPGSFTGLRVILATAKAIAYGAKLPLHGISSLAAMAYEARSLMPSASAIVPVLDARKKEVYAGFYRGGTGDLAPLLRMRQTSDGKKGDEAAAALSPERLGELLSSLEGPLLVFGEGYRVYQEVLRPGTEGRRMEVEGLPLTPPASAIAALASSEDLPFSKEAIFAMEPDYIRSSDAELGWTRPKGAI